MWAWTTSARTSARWAASAPTAIASSGSSMTRTGIAGPLELAHGAAGRQGHDRHVVAGGVDPADERVQVLLGAAVRAGRQDLDDADPALRSGPDARLLPGRDPRVVGQSSHVFLRRMSRRWIGSSTAPHSYLYGSSPRRKSSRRLPGRRRARRRHGPSRRPATGRARRDPRRRCSRGSRPASRSGSRPRSAGRRRSGMPGGWGRRCPTARTSVGTASGSGRHRWSAGTGRPRPSASGAGR